MYDKTEGETTEWFETWWVSSNIYNELDVFERERLFKSHKSLSLCVCTGVALVKIGWKQFSAVCNASFLTAYIGLRIHLNRVL